MRLTLTGDAGQASREVGLIGTDASWHIPEEVPVAFVYNRRNYAVMMATPADLQDFAVGFSLTERVVGKVADIEALEIRQGERGIDYRFTIAEPWVEKLEIVQRRRNMVGSASCGVCGLENADTLFEVLPKVSESPVELNDEAMVKAMIDLRDHQAVNAKTRSVHAAAFAARDGSILIAREDVGRHNALDKLLGALALADTDVRKGFVVMSSRCSYEIVEKAARRGIRSIVSISGPTAFALRKAEQARLSVYSRVIDNGQVGTVRLV